MKLISILEINAGIPEDLEVFVVHEEQLESDVMEVADKYFESCVRENSEEDITEEEIQHAIDIGYFENGDYEIRFLGSNIH